MASTLFGMQLQNYRNGPRDLCTRSVQHQSNHMFESSYRPRIFALIIGIDKYHSRRLQSLRGAVADAVAIKNYLVEDLHVPECNINLLHDEQATKAAILAGISSLLVDERIGYDDPILIYYAGHGASADAPQGWIPYGHAAKIQLLMPFDYGKESDGETTHCIPDRTIGFYLDSLSNKKGNNITVIFDCCHSASGTRDIDEDRPTYLVRGADITTQIIPNLDWDIRLEGRRMGDSVAKPDFGHRGLKSHVLLAACGAEEKAMEDNARGVFTAALLRTLKSVGADKMTYRDLIYHLPALCHQNPHCEGVNIDRMLFDSKASTKPPKLYKVYADKGEYVLQAGLADGITAGARFAVYGDRDLNTDCLGVLEAHEVTPFRTTLVPTQETSIFVLLATGYALQTRAGASANIRVFFRENQLKDDLRHILDGKIVLNKVESAQLHVSTDGDQIVFSVKDILTIANGWRRLPHAVPRDPELVRGIIDAAAHYFWHLDRLSNEHFLSSKVEVQFLKLMESEMIEVDGYLNAPLRPQYPEDNLNKNGVVTVFVDDKATYGINIINKSNISMYVSVFTFNSANFSIRSNYGPSVADGTADVSLKGGGTLTIGYGSTGTDAYQFSLEDRQIDMTYIKIFLSTEYIDLSNIRQDSPFHSDRTIVQVPQKRKEVWDTVVISVIQKRGVSPGGI